LRPLSGVTDPGTLVTVQQREPGGDDTGVSYRTLSDLDEAVSGIELAAWKVNVLFLASEAIEPVPVRAATVTGRYFPLLGVKSAAGRLFGEDAMMPGADGRIVVLSETFWRARLGADPGAVGSTLRLNGAPFTVVGVTERGFVGTDRTDRLDLWVPATAQAVLDHLPAGQDPLPDRSLRFLMNAFGRLDTDVTAEQAQDRMRAAMARLVEAYPREMEIHRFYRPSVFEGLGWPVYLRDASRSTVVVMGGAVALVLLIACANVANLLLFRSLGRTGESAVRRAIGASRARLVAQHLVESLLLAVPAALLGTILAWLGSLAIFRAGSLGGLAAFEPPLDLRTLVFATTVALGTAVLFGLAPAIQAAREGVLASLRGGARTATARWALARAGLTITQLALSVSLVAGALLLVRTLENLQRVEVGYDPAGVYVAQVNPLPRGYDRAAGRALIEDVAARLQEAPGIAGVALSYGNPTWGGIGYGVRDPEGTAAPVDAELVWVGAGYFGTLDIPLLAGRAFHSTETVTGVTPEVVVVSEGVARRLFGTLNVVGREVSVPGFGSSPDRARIIGVVGDIVGDPRRGPAATVYQPYQIAFGSALSVIARAGGADGGDGPRALEQLRSTLAALDPDLPLQGEGSLEEMLSAGLAQERTFARLLTLLASLAALLAGVGIYASTANAVLQRRREIGVRIALGAGPRQVVRRVTAGAVALGIVGVALGIAGALVLGRLLEARLFGVEALDPWVHVLTGLLALALVAVASLLPLRTALAIQPVEVLRTE
ncbi:MAG TPA: ABC transporter permease, partial [Longimicrobiales bacterium]